MTEGAAIGATRANPLERPVTKVVGKLPRRPERSELVCGGEERVMAATVTASISNRTTTIEASSPLRSGGGLNQ